MDASVTAVRAKKPYRFSEIRESDTRYFYPKSTYQGKTCIHLVHSTGSPSKLLLGMSGVERVLSANRSRVFPIRLRTSSAVHAPPSSSCRHHGNRFPRPWIAVDHHRSPLASDHHGVASDRHCSPAASRDFSRFASCCHRHGSHAAPTHPCASTGCEHHGIGSGNRPATKHDPTARPASGNASGCH